MANIRAVPTAGPGDLRRFMANVEVDPETGCWVWKGKCFDHGYGYFMLEGRARRAHRVLYVWTKGDPGVQLDHVCHDPRECSGGRECRHRKCVNPDHLVPSSARENVIEFGSGPSARNAHKTHCTHGHEFTAENTYYDKGGWRQCRACAREKTRRHREQNHEKVLARRRELRVRVVHEPRSCARPGCDNLFVPVRETKKYCSASCLQRDGYARRNQKKEA